MPDNDLLAAARAALPGLTFEVDSANAEAVVFAVYGARIETCGINHENGKFVAWLDNVGQCAPTTCKSAAKWLRAQVEARRDALTAALGDAPQAVEPVDDPFDLPMPGPDCSATEHVPGCRHATKDDCTAAECEHGGRRDCVFGEPLHYHHDGCPAGYSEGVEPCDREELQTRLGDGWIPVAERLPEQGRYVPVVTTSGRVAFAQYRTPTKRRPEKWSDNHNCERDVVRWFDLPAPPKV